MEGRLTGEQMVTACFEFFRAAALALLNYARHGGRRESGKDFRRTDGSAVEVSNLDSLGSQSRLSHSHILAPFAQPFPPSFIFSLQQKVTFSP